MKKRMWARGNTIFIKVLPGFFYDARIVGIGTPENPPGTYTMWGWLNHLRDKNWWSDAEMLNKFVSLSVEIISKNEK